MGVEPLRKRIGVLVPAGNIAHEREFAALAPPGVEFNFAGFAYPAPGPTFCADLIRAVEAPLLSLGPVDQVLFGCATASVVCPQAGTAMEAIVHAPVVMAAQVSVDALKRRGARVVALATPYGSATNQIIADFLKRNGIATAGLVGLDLDAAAMARAGHIPEDEVMALALDADTPQADAIYLPCTALGSLGILPRLTARTGKPVISSILAGFEALDLGPTPAAQDEGRA